MQLLSSLEIMRSGKLVSIRKIEPADFEHVSKHHYTLSITEPLIDVERIRELYAKTEFWTEQSGAVALIENESSRLVGSIQFYQSDWGIDGLELGYIIHSESDRRKGYMTEGVTLLTHYLFEERDNLNRLQIMTNPSNIASWQIAEKCGYHKEGELRESDWNNDSVSNRLIYSMLRSEFEILISNNHQQTAHEKQNKIDLVPITPDNYDLAMALTVRPDQQDLVASVQKTLADAYVYKRSLFRIAYYGDKPVGYLLVYPYQSVQRQYVNIVRLAIDYRFQRRGLGRNLLETTLSWIRKFEPKVDVVRISTLPKNTPAHSLYKSLGFVEKGVEEGEIALYIVISQM